MTQRSGPEGDTEYDYLIVGNNLVTTVTNPAGQDKKTTVDRSGRVIRSEDYGGMLIVNRCSIFIVETAL